MTLVNDIRNSINCHSRENASNTPDFVLADYLEKCLVAFEQAVGARMGVGGPTRTGEAKEAYAEGHRDALEMIAPKIGGMTGPGNTVKNAKGYSAACTEAVHMIRDIINKST